ncbi:saccharopine dehydrogenase NADP-binding domain-containing protein [Exiguobacterium sp. s152]|uniref:saccharopine dehydrogenase family protein n=1 Tax=Exiguobacterium sp. s152 TaxID=2751226 RepID=UPI001BEA5354|nr:saccharopine dehydrogenase NADP-binding domain-containing protein [Exiguobacterium sp. s152]
MKWMIYGANGYTGELIARQAVKQGMTPVLAGRRADAIAKLGEELGCETRVFNLSLDKATRQLEDIDLVLHCAGPFADTSRPMVEACLATKTHYLDITGEMEVFEYIHSKKRAKLAQEAGVLLCSGVGFDVIPTDCVARKLKELMPDAMNLALGFSAAAGISRGTLKTAIRGLGSSSAERKDGELTPFPLGEKRRHIDFGRGKKTAIAIPWGDVSTAYYTTGIPNITTWVPVPTAYAYGARLLSWFGPILGSDAVQGKLLRYVDEHVSGPEKSERERSSTYVWGEATNASGRKVIVRIKTASTYAFTVYGALEVVSRLVSSGRVIPGSFTPAMLFGSHFIEEIEGSSSFVVDEVRL